MRRLSDMCSNVQARESRAHGIVLLLVIVVLSRFTAIKTELGTRGSLARMLAILVVLNLAIVLVETMILDYRGRVSYSVLVEGQYVPMLWGAVAVGAIVPLAILADPGTRRLGPMLAIASVLSLAGIFLIRLILLLQGTTYPHIAYPLG